MDDSDLAAAVRALRHRRGWRQADLADHAGVSAPAKIGELEVKTLIVEVQAILGGLSVKTRVAPRLARELAWRPATVVPALVVRDATTNRRRIAEHARLFARLSLRGRSARSWLGQPAGAPEGVLLMLDLPNPGHAGARRAGRQRVRPATGVPRSAGPSAARGSEA